MTDNDQQTGCGDTPTRPDAGEEVERRESLARHAGEEAVNRRAFLATLAAAGLATFASVSGLAQSRLIAPMQRTLTFRVERLQYQVDFTALINGELWHYAAFRETDEIDAETDLADDEAEIRALAARAFERVACA